MDSLEYIENFASENLEIANFDEKLAKMLKKLAKSELKKSKVLYQLIKTEKRFTELSKDLAEAIKDSVEEKLEIKKKGIIKFSDEELKHEISQSLYNGKVAIIQNALTDLNQQKAELEEKIAHFRDEYADDKINMVKTQRTLSEKIRAFIKLVRSDAPKDTIMDAKRNYEEIKDKLLQDKKYIKEREVKIKEIIEKLADLEKAIGIKLSDLEKIRHSY